MTWYGGRRDWTRTEPLYESAADRRAAKNERRRAERAERRANLIPRLWIDGIEIGEPADCWRWLKSLDTGGYPQVRIGGRKGRTMRAHRLIADLVHGLGAGPVHHTCRNRWCVNPAHLVPTDSTLEHWSLHGVV